MAAPVALESVCTVCDTEERTTRTLSAEELDVFVAEQAEYICEDQGPTCSICTGSMSSECSGDCCDFMGYDNHTTISISRVCIDRSGDTPVITQLVYRYG